jgi:CMP-N,N'-diacetyllegionaminic acid synthase
LIDNHRILAVIPARSGSKGIKDKNIKLLNNKPLLSYTIEAAQRSKIFSEIVVSTDSELYANISKEYGASVPFLRNALLASDTASSWDVVKEVIRWYSDHRQNFKTVVLLQPTSPLRTAQDIIDSFSLFLEKKANMIVSVCKADHSPLWYNILPKDLSLGNFINKEVQNLPRQELPCYYRINGAIYIIKKKYLMEGNELYSNDSYAYIMPRERSVDIDDNIDLALAEILLKQDNARIL